VQLVFHNPAFSFQLLRIMGQTYYGGADIGECLSTAYQIREGDIESWYNEWLKTANRVYSYAEDCMSKGHKVSARDAYLRATNYYQNGAAFYLDTNPSDPRITSTWEKGVEAFRKAIGLFANKVETIEIPYDGTTLPGYFFNAPDEKYNGDGNNNTSQKQVSAKEKPTLILTTGLDGSQEELYFLGVVAALERGYNCLTFEGPGQGSVVRKQKLHFRADWEKVVSSVIDFALSSKKQEEVIDSQR
jgi:hypothetical protein